MFDWISDDALVALIGLASGTLLGLAARIGRFCTLGAIEDMFYGGSTERIRMWILSIGIAITGTFALTGLGFMDVSESLYLSIEWVPLASVVGGLTFGYGMALSGNCGHGIIARLGGGDMRAFVMMLVMGLSAFVVLSGPLGYLREWLFSSSPVTGTPPGIAHLLSSMTGLPVATIGIFIGVALSFAALTSREMLDNPKSIFWSIAVGTAIISGWAGTYWVAANGFAAIPVTSHSFSIPVGEAILYAMTASARPLTFGTGAVAGVVLGSVAGSLFKRQFRWEACEDPRELRRQIAGAALIGAGAVIALGCTIGQGMSAFSVLSYSAPITFLSIIAGAAFGLRQLISGFNPAI